MDSDDLDLTLATCQAHNTVPICRAIAGYMSAHLSRPIHFQEDIDWSDAYRSIASGDIDLGWICGRPYTRLIDEKVAPIRLLVAPVMVGERYQDRPIYFSDVIVRSESPFHQFADLRGASWAYNESGSQSGYHVTLYHLAQMGETGRFFGRVVGSGSHLRSIAMVLNGEIDGSAIDSTVLEWEMLRKSSLINQIRVIDTLGPSPIPPLIISTRLSGQIEGEIRNHLLALHTHAEGRRILAMGRLARFEVVEDADYDTIRRMSRISAAISM